MNTSPKCRSSERRRSSLVRFFDENTASIDDDSDVQNYGSVDTLEQGGNALDGHRSADLGHILEDQEMQISLNGGCKPLRDSSSDGDAYESSDDESCDSLDMESRISSLSSKSFHPGESIRMSARNIMIHERPTTSFLEYGDEYELIPTKLKKNVRLVEDMNMYDGGRGRLYLACYSFYKNDHETKYALTVHPDIYQRIMSEVSDAHSVPCGLFFCCHGGDGAHTGVSHSDFVDIKLAWFVFAFVIGCIFIVEITEME